MKILIVDDHALFRDGLCHVLHALEDSITILEASNCDLAIQYAAENTDLDLVLLDLNMPGKDGFAALASFTKTYPALPVVILSASSLRSDMQRALDSGAMGYVPKDTTSAVMINALRLILSGGVYLPPEMRQQQHLDQNNSNISILTPRQLQVLALLVQGRSNKVIAAEMNLAEATVKMHVTSILKSLGVSNRTQAAISAERLWKP
jgi:DNA-binding NarL/FixJ family response regulator